VLAIVLALVWHYFVSVLRVPPATPLVHPESYVALLVRRGPVFRLERLSDRRNPDGQPTREELLAAELSWRFFENRFVDFGHRRKYVTPSA
jgi:hypothetical protein